MWDYVLWTIIVLATLYAIVRLVFAAMLRKERYKG